MTLLLLVGFELILGMDNVLIISLMVVSLPLVIRERARKIGLLLALLFRLIFVAGAFWIVQSTTPFFFHFSARDLSLILGGFFITGKAGKELYQMIAFPETRPLLAVPNKRFFSVVIQIVLLDLVFSIDSVITAIGLTSELLIICTAVTVSFIALLFYIGPVGEFILRHHSMKIIALFFLILLGISFMAEGCGYSIDKNYLYSIVLFALLMEMLKKRYRKNHSR